MFTTVGSVENRGLRSRPLGPRGPRPATLSPSRAALLESLRRQPEPVALSALAETTGLHVNTLREHLDALTRHGLVTRHRAAPSGRGRPAWLYEATGDATSGSGPDELTEYAGLASALAAAIERVSDQPARDAARAGEDWGRDLARATGAQPDSPEAARDAVVGLLDDLGFEPRRTPGDAAAVHLTRCPLLQAAYRNTEVVCSVHLGVVRGALGEYGADPAGSGLEPFADPGSCLLTVPPVSRARSGRTAGSG